MSSSWHLLTCSWHVLKTDKQLVVFPILSGLAALLVMATFVSGLFLNLDFVREAAELEKRTGELNPILLLWFFGYYFANYFVMTYFNAALVSCALIRFAGGTPTIGMGLRAANSRLPYIFGWALLAATVGMILKQIEERSNLVGQFVVAILGAAWTISTFLVVPVLVVEKRGPWSAFQRSASLITQTWGTSLISQFKIGMIQLILSIPMILIMVVGLMRMKDAPELGMTLIGLAILGFVILGLVMSVLQGIFVAALYQFTAFNQVPDGFERGVLRSAFETR